MKNLVYLLLGLMIFLAACGNDSGEASTSDESDESAASDSGSEENAEGEAASDDPINVVWYPNESGSELEDGRDEIGAIIEDATGRPVEHELTTDYAIAIESIANDNADLVKSIIMCNKDYSTHMQLRTKSCVPSPAMAGEGNFSIRPYLCRSFLLNNLRAGV